MGVIITLEMSLTGSLYTYSPYEKHFERCHRLHEIQPWQPLSIQEAPQPPVAVEKAAGSGRRSIDSCNIQEKFRSIARESKLSLALQDFAVLKSFGSLIFELHKALEYQL